MGCRPSRERPVTIFRRVTTPLARPVSPAAEPIPCEAEAPLAQPATCDSWPTTTSALAARGEAGDCFAPRVRDSLFFAVSMGTLAFFLWGQRSKGSYVHVDVVVDRDRVGELVVFIFTTWSTITDFAKAKAPLFSGLLGVCSGVQPFLSVAALLALHAARRHPRVVASRALRRRRRVALEFCAHLIKFTRSMDASAYIFTVALRIDSRTVGGVKVLVRAFPSLGILVNEIGNLVTVGLCFWALVAEALEDDEAGGSLARVPSQEAFWFTPRRPAVRRDEPEEGDAPSILAVAAAAGSCALLPVALCLPIFTMTNEEALSAFVPGGPRTYSVLSLVAAPVATRATQTPLVSTAYASWFAFWFVLCPALDAGCLFLLVASARRSRAPRPHLRRACSALRACSSLEVLIAVLVAMAKELGQITAWIIREAAPDAICDKLDCFKVIATLEPVGVGCLAAVVVSQVALYCSVIVTPRVRRGMERRSLLRASLLERRLAFEEDGGVA